MKIIILNEKYQIKLMKNFNSADPFLYMLIGGLVELPCYVLGGGIVRVTGRRRTIIVALLVTGGANLAPLAFDDGRLGRVFFSVLKN